jgi:hypothetical protein
MHRSAAARASAPTPLEPRHPQEPAPSTALPPHSHGTTPAWAIPRRALRCPSAPRTPAPPRHPRAGSSDEAPPPLAFVPRGAATAATEQEAGGAHHAARLVGLAVAEALRGQRTVQQLGHHLDLECYRKVERRVRWEREARLAARLCPDPGELRMLSCHVQAVTELACEATCTLSSPQRVRALCFRLERQRGRWLCVEIEIG